MTQTLPLPLMMASALFGAGTISSFAPLRSCSMRRSRSLPLASSSLNFSTYTFFISARVCADCARALRAATSRVRATARQKISLRTKWKAIVCMQPMLETPRSSGTSHDSSRSCLGLCVRCAKRLPSFCIVALAQAVRWRICVFYNCVIYASDSGSWTKKGYDRWRAEIAPAAAQSPRGRWKHGGKKLLGLIEGQGDAEQVRFARVRILFVARSMGFAQLDEHIPGTVRAEEAFFGGVLAGDFHDVMLCASANFQQDSGREGRCEFAGGIVVREGSQQRFQLRLLGRKTLPRVAIAVVDDRAGVQDLLHAGDVFAGDAHHHIYKFAQAERLLYHGAEAYVACVFVDVTNGNLLRQGHEIEESPDAERVKLTEFGQLFAHAIA